jgi:hypothetical protein
MMHDRKVWYSKDIIVNIISISRVKERYPVIYDSRNGNQFFVDNGGYI